MFCDELECLHHAENTHLKRAITVLEERVSQWITMSNDPKVDIAMETAKHYLGSFGAMISWSKSGYLTRHPADLVVFNSNVCVEPNKKIWWGDLNITEKIPQLQQLANVLQKKVYVLYEMDGRFDNEASPKMDRPAQIFVPK